PAGPRADRVPRSPLLRRGLDRRASLRGLRDHSVAGGVHRSRGRAHAPHPARNGRLLAPLSSPAHPGRPHDPARPPDARAGDVRRRPGRAASDAFMMGIDPLRQREMMDEALEAILALFRADEPVTRECGWFTLRDARLHMRPYTRPHMEMAVAAQVSPAGARAAGKYGLGLLSLGATTAGGFDVLGSQWAVAEEMAAEHGKTVERARWRLVGPMHIAPTMDQARADVAFGLPAWVDYFQRVAALPLVGDATELGDMIDAMNGTGLAVIGTPDDAAAQIERLWEKSGGFGTYLFMAHDWADREATLRSY